MREESQVRIFKLLRENGIDELNGIALDEIGQELVERSLNRPDAEKQAIVKDLANRLSGEAREIIRIVLNAPEEMVEYLWGSREKQITKITQQDLRQYLNWSLGWPFLVIEEVFGELKRFVKNF